MPKFQPDIKFLDTSKFQTRDNPIMTKKNKYTFIDLFAGCGGLSEGFLQTGKFEGIAHVEWETPMINTLRQRLIDKWHHTEDDAKNVLLNLMFKKQKNLFMVIGATKQRKNMKRKTIET